ncbi:unnamed protein product [Cochlearia groenlandica]
MFSLDLHASESDKFIFVASESKTTRFVFSLDVSKPHDGLKLLTPRVDGIDTFITVHRLHAEGQPLSSLQSGRSVGFVDPVYSVDSTESEFSSNVLRFCYSSLKTPPSVYDYDMTHYVVFSVLESFDASNYVTEKKWVAASDGTQIPMSIVYNKNLAKLDGSDLIHYCFMDMVLMRYF